MESNNLEIEYDLSPLCIVYKDGKVERLIGTEIVPPSAADLETGVGSKDVVIKPDTGISARLYKPKPTNPDQKLPVLVYFHGGAFLVQTAFSPTYQPFLNSLASQANVIIVSVEYRRAPEHPLPVGYYDSWAAVKWVVSHSGGDGEEEWLRDCADFGRVFFAGDSAGANIAHNMAIRVGSDGLDGGELAGLVLMHPFFWGKDPTGDETTDVGVREYVEKVWLSACPTSTGLDDPWINPVMDPKWSGMGCAKVLVVVAEGDVLKHRGWLYYEELRKSGWGGEVEIMETEGEEHVFYLEKPHCDKAKDLVKRVASFLKSDQAYISK
ncbi:hypothetical protein RHGRI_032681 [Rhododendron griersonianum]|uniref:Alpha/beta hydrolase fold-3 domain-containing protein n=1 Tax=Rhododendron griersonianum TaxID=479676 RepID=A0AAV6IG98_9ERIC|nr:hypothetical protein RHGRI_032681 [Rhododendron griersonianum]